MRLAAFSSPSALTSTLRTNSSPPTPTDVWLSTAVVNSPSTLRTSSRDTLLSSAMAAAEPLHVLGAEMLENLRRLALAERQQQDGRALDAVATALAPALHSSVGHPRLHHLRAALGIRRPPGRAPARPAVRRRWPELRAVAPRRPRAASARLAQAPATSRH